jgi:hypothetical protein
MSDHTSSIEQKGISTGLRVTDEISGYTMDYYDRVALNCIVHDWRMEYNPLQQDCINYISSTYTSK